MEYIILQYVSIVLLVVGVGYLLYLLKEKESKFNEDYYGITYSILRTHNNKEITSENVKKILRIISKVVLNVEDNYKNDDNKVKEDKALQFTREALKELKFRRTIDDDSIRYIIRISAALLPPTNQVNPKSKGSAAGNK
ncbi:hypothetical protein JMF89_16325 [Clostridiaceae bacterium UIB06]|nr:hypothetical protein [Clostridiaceae bacterium UIB06]